MGRLFCRGAQGGCRSGPDSRDGSPAYGLDAFRNDDGAVAPSPPLADRYAAGNRRRGGARPLLVWRARKPSREKRQRDRRRQMKYAIVIAFAVATGFLASGCSGPTPAKASTPAEADRLIVAVATARQQDMIRTAQAQGALFPKEKAVLAAEVEGALAQVYADMGDRVTQGQVLARIDPR